MQAKDMKACANAESMPVAWFAALEYALRKGDLERAAYAKRQLRDLGVTVHFRKGAIRVGSCRGMDTRGGTDGC